jgi:hypothetical protein
VEECQLYPKLKRLAIIGFFEFRNRLMESVKEVDIHATDE